jgi:hypothetical protein
MRKTSLQLLLLRSLPIYKCKDDHQGDSYHRDLFPVPLTPPKDAASRYDLHANANCNVQSPL